MYEDEFAEFLVKKLGNAGGSIQLQHITGHMSQLRNEVRHSIGTSMSDLKQFLAEHPNLFFIDNNVVSLASSSMLSTSGYDSDNSSIGPQIRLPSLISKGKGVIVKLFPTYGFIKSKEPIKTEIYFSASSCGDRNFDLTSFLYLGASVYFNAQKSDRPGSKYVAKKVWRADNSDPQENVIKQKSRKNRETGLYDPLTLDGEGIIQNVFPNIGFIAVNGDDTNTVFFYKKRVVNYSNITDLTKVFSIGDAVEFNAHRSTKSDAKARWEATKVWKKSGKLKKNASISDSSQCTDKLALSKQSVSNITNKSIEMIKDQPGKICPRSHGAVIKFGKNELADGDSAQYFVCGSQVTEIAWEFTDGDNVKFDAVKIKSAPGWKAVLVWVGVKPDIVLPACLEDLNELTDEENGEFSSSVYTSKSNSSLSLCSTSSLKSVSAKSESVSSKKNDFANKQTSKLSDTATNKQIEDNKKTENHYYFRNNQNSEDLTKEENGFSNKFNSNVSNWGDSTYPDDDPENIYSSNDNVSDNRLVENIHQNVIKILDTGQNISKDISVEEISDEEINNELSNSDIKTDIKNYLDDSNNMMKKTAYIKKFQNIEGKINKVYSKFAEVKSCNLQKNVPFYWNDFYSNGLSVEELELDDLKKVLKVGDTVYFNYFTIVDDSGQSWQKVSLVWNGFKPKKPVESTPEDFIKENELSVTINDEINTDQVQEDLFTPRKFLSSYTDEIHDKLSKVECKNEADKCLTNIVQDSQVKLSETLQRELGDFKKLSNIVCQILKKDLLSTNSKVDLCSVSEEIINIVLENYNQIKSDDNSFNALSQENSIEKISDICSKCKEKCISNISCQEVTTKDCDVQTIITGEIIAQNVFTEC